MLYSLLRGFLFVLRKGNKRTGAVLLLNLAVPLGETKRLVDSFKLLYVYLDAPSISFHMKMERKSVCATVNGEKLFLMLTCLHS